MEDIYFSKSPGREEAYVMRLLTRQTTHITSKKEPIPLAAGLRDPKKHTSPLKWMHMVANVMLNV